MWKFWTSVIDWTTWAGDLNPYIPKMGIKPWGFISLNTRKEHLGLYENILTKQSSLIQSYYDHQYLCKLCSTVTGCFCQSSIFIFSYYTSDFKRWYFSGMSWKETYGELPQHQFHQYIRWHWIDRTKYTMFNRGYVMLVHLDC